MAERRSSYEGPQPSQRQRSPPLEYPTYQYDSLNTALNTQPPSSSRTRRRPSRTGSGSQVSSQSASSSCVDGDRGGGKRSKSGRKTLKKSARRDSAYSEVSVRSHSTQSDEEGRAAGYRPRLGQIREGKVSKTPSSQASSGNSSNSEPPTHRRLHIEDRAVDRFRVRHKRPHSQRHGANPTWQSNPSEVSIASGSSARSSTSAGSRSTVTQAQFEDESIVDERRAPASQNHSRKSARKRVMAATIEPNAADVFQYMSESPSNDEFTVEEVHDTPPSTIAPSSSATNSGSEHEDDHSSSGGEDVRDTSTTSPATMRNTRPEPPTRRSGSYHDPKIPLYASSFVHGHDEEEEEDEDSDEAGDSEDESEEEEDEEDERCDIVHDENVRLQALERTSPPTAPPAAAQNDDPRAQRLKLQEQELANHVLQSPQPHKDFQFSGGPSPHPAPSIPMYSPRAYSNATPAHYEATPSYPPEWPPFPAPLPIGYPTQTSLESPNSAHALPLTVQPPVGPPTLPTQQAVPPLHHFPGQLPPHYQAHVPVTDMTRTTVAGYELLATKLSEPAKGSKAVRKGGNIVPIYRKFENLNHRVLLHLQDEICEMEEELRELDESIIQTSPKDETGHAYPASRRGDAEYGNELHYKRTELLGRIFQKLGQYNQAMTSFSNLVKDTEPASPVDIQAYRAWLDKRVPIDQEETRFLDRRHDLLAVSRRTCVSTAKNGQHGSAAAWVPLALVLPFLAFAIVPSMLGRLVVIALIGAAEFRLVTTTPEVKSLMSVRDWGIAGAIYFGLMSLLAGLVR